MASAKEIPMASAKEIPMAAAKEISISNNEKPPNLPPEDSMPSHLSHEQEIRKIDFENINFAININGIIGNLGPNNFLPAIHAISTALFVLQKEDSPRHTLNISMLANKFLQTHCQN